MRNRIPPPTCDRTSCFGCIDGHCTVLIEVPEKECRFYKSREQLKKDREKARERLLEVTLEGAVKNGF